MPKILSDNGHSVATLDSLNVLSLQALRAFDHVELHGLALLQASESARLNRREMHKNIFAGLTADEAVAFGVVEPRSEKRLNGTRREAAKKERP
jgi:hypothetical protein